MICVRLSPASAKRQEEFANLVAVSGSEPAGAFLAGYKASAPSSSASLSLFLALQAGLKPPQNILLKTFEVFAKLRMYEALVLAFSAYGPRTNTSEEKRLIKRGLLEACISGAAKCAQLFIDFGAEISPSDDHFISRVLDRQTVASIALEQECKQEEESLEAVLQLVLRTNVRLTPEHSEKALSAGGFAIGVLRKATASASSEQLKKLLFLAVDQTQKRLANNSEANVKYLLEQKADANSTVDPWGSTLLDVAIANSCVPVAKVLLEYGADFEGSNLNKVIDSDMLTFLENYVRERANVATEILASSVSGNACGLVLDFLCSQKTPSFVLKSGRAIIGNLPELRELQEEKAHPEKKGRWNKTQWCNVPVRPGRWLMCVSPFMQICFHEECSEEFLINVVGGAVLGGFGSDEWNPKSPSVDKIFFTGRMTFSNCEPYNITWFCDENADLSELESVPVYEPVWREGGALPICTTSSAGMWTSRQEYKYGILAENKCFISIGYEGMDSKDKHHAYVVDAVLRAKAHAEKPVLSFSSHAKITRTQFTDNPTPPVLKIRTNQEKLEDELSAGNTFDGFDSFKRLGFTAPAHLVGYFGPSETMFPASEIDHTLMTPLLASRMCSLIDELMMTWVNEFVVPRVKSLDKHDVESVANTLFPTDGKLDIFALEKMTNVIKTNNSSSSSGSTSSGSTSTSSDFLVLSLRKFLAARDVELDDLTLSAICEALKFFVSEIMELAYNCARDFGRTTILPIDIRFAALNDHELSPLFGDCRAMWPPREAEGSGAL